MSRLLLKSGSLSLLTVIFSAAVIAQEPTPTPKKLECSVPIDRGKELDKKPKILLKPEPTFTKSDVAAHRSERITLSVVLCGSGAVTDISVIKGLSDAMNEAAIKAARQIQFTPAEKHGQKVSRVVIVVYIVGGVRGP
jgi:TonB family protein